MFDKITAQKSFKLDQAFVNDVRKRQIAFLSLEDYHYDILNMETHCSESFESEHRKSTNDVC